MRRGTNRSGYSDAVESDPIASVRNPLRGFVKNCDETVSQIKPNTRSPTAQSGCRVVRLRDAHAAAFCPIAVEYTGKRPVTAVPLSESPLWMSIGRTVLEEVLLLQ